MLDVNKTKSQLIQELENLRLQVISQEPERHQLLNRAVEASANGIVIADARLPDMPLIYVNPAFETMSGFSSSECLGRNCRFLHKDDRDQAGLEQVRQSIGSKSNCHVVIRNYRKNGSLFWNELYLSPVMSADGHLTHYIGIQNDISKQVQLQESKDLFLQIASHDLKSPLSAVLMSADILCRIAPVGTSVTKDLHSILLSIASRGKEMNSIIADYLDFMALEDGQIRLAWEELDLQEAIHEVVVNNQEYARKKSIELVFVAPSFPYKVNVDRQKINQVVQNLIGNAIKYCNKGDTVTIHISPGKSGVCVKVTDTGPGLKSVDLEKVFTRYAKLSNKPTAGEKSSGLGLYICKMLIDLHGGHIGVFNNKDRGATFWFELKCEPA